MKQQNWPVVVGSAIAILALNNPAYAALIKPNTSTEITSVALRVPPPPVPKIGRGSRGNNVYAIAPSEFEGLNIVWRTQPVLIWEGALSRVEIHAVDTDERLWMQSVSAGDRTLVYGGETLEPGQHYKWTLYDSLGDITDVVRFQIVTAEDRDRIATDLAEIDANAKINGTSSEDIELARTSYFANQKLLADMLMEDVLADSQSGFHQAKVFLTIVEHITRWVDVAEFVSKGDDKIHPDDIQIEFFPGSEPGKKSAQLEEPYELTYQFNQAENEWEEPDFRAKLTNHSSVTLFFALLDLTEDFAIESLLEKGTIKLTPGQEFWLNDGEPIYGVIPGELLEKGVTYCKDIYKIIACTVDFNPDLLTQGNLDETSSQNSSSSRKASSLKQLIEQFDGQGQDNHGLERHSPQWISNQVTLTFIQP
jgi:hypothetical protein